MNKNSIFTGIMTAFFWVPLQFEMLKWFQPRPYHKSFCSVSTWSNHSARELA